MIIIVTAQTYKQNYIYDDLSFIRDSHWNYKMFPSCEQQSRYTQLSHGNLSNKRIAHRTITKICQSTMERLEDRYYYQIHMACSWLSFHVPVSRHGAQQSGWRRDLLNARNSPFARLSAFSGLWKKVGILTLLVQT